jgi:hypothetical protein
MLFEQASMRLCCFRVTELRGKGRARFVTLVFEPQFG